MAQLHRSSQLNLVEEVDEDVSDDIAGGSPRRD